MTKETLEHLSCLMDGELSSEAGRFLARRMGTEASLGDTWQRYHLIRDCLRRPGERHAFLQLKVDLEHLESEGDVAAPRRAAPRWLRPVAGTAIAASVAALAVLVSLNLGPAPDSVEPEPFASPNSVRPPRSQPAGLSSVQAASPALNRYIIRHNQAAGAVGQQGFVSITQIAPTTPVKVVEQAEAEPPSAADDANTGDR